MKSALIVGGTGFIGGSLRDKLIANGVPTTTMSRTKCALGHPLLTHVVSDVRDTETVAKLVADAEVVFYLVSTSTPSTAEVDWKHDLEMNLLPLTTVVETCSQRSSRLVFASSGGAIYGAAGSAPVSEEVAAKPISVYGFTKLLSEKVIEFGHFRHGLPASIMRISNPFGPGQLGTQSQGVIARFMRAALTGETVELWGDGSIVRDYIFIEDVVDALIKAGDARTGLDIFNVGSGVGRSVNDIISSIESVTGKKININPYPGRKIDVPKNILSIDKAERKLKWRPKSDFLESMRRTAEVLYNEIG